MGVTKISRVIVALTFLFALLAVALPALAQTETVLYSFGSQSGDGANPYAGVIWDAEGNLYGTTVNGGANGGANGYGSVFKLTPSGTETVLHSFASNGTDGVYPYAGLFMDTEGNLYGTTYQGGANGYGTVIKLTPSGTETVLHSFSANGFDGVYHYGGLVMDKKHKLYGTTDVGGEYGVGTVFKLTPSGPETVLHSFAPSGTDGFSLFAGLIMGKKHNLYGTTYAGGKNGYGTVFKMTSSGAETVLYNFCPRPGCADGEFPYAGLVTDRKGNLYGTTLYGGANNYGTVFEVSATGTHTVLYNFTGSSTDGYDPFAGLVVDKNGNLYGASAYASGNSYGVVFELSPGKKGAPWTFKSLHAFETGSGDGLAPFGTLILDTEGNLYGTTVDGGANTIGTVFKVTP